MPATGSAGWLYYLIHTVLLGIQPSSEYLCEGGFRANAECRTVCQYSTERWPTLHVELEVHRPMPSRLVRHFGSNQDDLGRFIDPKRIWSEFSKYFAILQLRQ